MLWRQWSCLRRGALNNLFHFLSFILRIAEASDAPANSEPPVPVGNGVLTEVYILFYGIRIHSLLKVLGTWFRKCLTNQSLTLSDVPMVEAERVCVQVIIWKCLESIIILYPSDLCNRGGGWGDCDPHPRWSVLAPSSCFNTNCWLHRRRFCVCLCVDFFYLFAFREHWGWRHRAVAQDSWITTQSGHSNVLLY